MIPCSEKKLNEGLKYTKSAGVGVYWVKEPIRYECEPKSGEIQTNQPSEVRYPFIVVRRRIGRVVKFATQVKRFGSIHGDRNERAALI